MSLLCTQQALAPPSGHKGQLSLVDPKRQLRLMLQQVPVLYFFWFTCVILTTATVYEVLIAMDNRSGFLSQFCNIGANKFNFGVTPVLLKWTAKRATALYMIDME
jgi:hypothetical protein